MKSLGQRVKQRRSRLGYQAKYVAKEIGISPGGLSLFENGHSEGIDFVLGVKLANVLQFDPQVLAFGLKIGNRPNQNINTAIIGDEISGPDPEWFDIDVEKIGTTDEVVEISINQSKNSYALKITQNTGRYLAGEAIILDPSPKVKLEPGEDVFVMYPQGCQLMRFLYERNEQVHLIGFEDDSNMLKLNKEECQYLHPIVAIATKSKIKPDPARSKKGASI